VHQALLTRFSNPRACDPQRLAEELHRHRIPTQITPDPAAALALARKLAQPSDLICVTGSLMLIGELKARLQGLALEF
jgi:dihydrofolate synthase/folylpolyglutamate synthase